MALALARRPLQSFSLAAALIVAGCALLVRSPAFTRAPGPLSLAVALDLTVTASLAWLFLVVRAGRAKALTVSRVFLAGLAVAALLLPATQRGTLGLVRLLGAPLELAVLVWLGLRARDLRRAFLRRKAPEDDFAETLAASFRDVFGSSRAAAVFATEISICWFALASWRTRPPARFTLHKRCGWTAIALALCLACLAEVVPAHVLVARFSVRAAWLLTAATLYSMLWIVGDLQAIRLRGVRIAGGMLRVRLGMRAAVDVPLEQIARLGDQPGATRIALAGTPHITLQLRAPVEVLGLFGRRTLATALSLQLDDLEGFLAELRRHRPDLQA